MRPMPLVLLLSPAALLGLMAVLSSCSGSASGPPPSCSGSFEACGGDLVGTWGYVADCNAPTETIPGCPIATISGKLKSSTTYTFGSDGSFTNSTSVQGTLTVTIPASCVLNDDCQPFETCFGIGGLAVTRSCAGNSKGGCTCKEIDTGSYMETGVYSTSGSTLVFDTLASQAYCVRGNELDLLDFGDGGANAYSLYAKQ